MFNTINSVDFCIFSVVSSSSGYKSPSTIFFHCLFYNDNCFFYCKIVLYVYSGEKPTPFFCCGSAQTPRRWEAVGLVAQSHCKDSGCAGRAIAAAVGDAVGDVVGYMYVHSGGLSIGCRYLYVDVLALVVVVVFANFGVQKSAGQNAKWFQG